VKRSRLARVSAAVAGIMVAGIVAAAIAIRSCSDDDGHDPLSVDLGRSLAAGLVGAIERSAGLGEPFRCAELGPAAAGAAPAELGKRGGRTLALDGDWLRLGAADRGRDLTLVAGVVADARGASAATLTQVGRVRAEFERERVELVISLGGMGTTEPELTQVLGALARDAPWVVWAIPGDREAIPAHRAAVAALFAAGYPVFDATRTRMVEVDGAVLAAFPGAEEPSRLLAGGEGCVHRPEDASALALRLKGQKWVRVWAGHSAPRQSGPEADDVALGGVHVGERELAAALPAARPHLVLHGMVDEAALGKPSGQTSMDSGPTILGSGPLEAMPITGPDGAAFAGAALVVRANASEGDITWKRIRFPLGGSGPAR
jgi:hypothetical protein